MPLKFLLVGSEGKNAPRKIKRKEEEAMDEDLIWRIDKRRELRVLGHLHPFWLKLKNPEALVFQQGMKEWTWRTVQV